MRRMWDFSIVTGVNILQLCHCPIHTLLRSYSEADSNTRSSSTKISRCWNNFTGYEIIVRLKLRFQHKSWHYSEIIVLSLWQQRNIMKTSQKISLVSLAAATVAVVIAVSREPKVRAALKDAQINFGKWYKKNFTSPNNWIHGKLGWPSNNNRVQWGCRKWCVGFQHQFTGKCKSVRPFRFLFFES